MAAARDESVDALAALSTQYLDNQPRKCVLKSLTHVRKKKSEVRSQNSEVKRQPWIFTSAF